VKTDPDEMMSESDAAKAFEATLSDDYFKIREEEEQRIEDLAVGWFTKKEAKQEVSRLLRDFHLDESVIEAQAILASSTELVWLENMLTSLETRRDKRLTQITAYRESFAKRLRESSDQIIEAGRDKLPALRSTKRSAA
jgi:hypothetical protein